LVTLSRLIAHVLEDKAPDEPFGASAVTEEIHQHWGGKLRRKVNPRSVSSALRRWAAAGHLHRTRDGRSHRETLYVKKGRKRVAGCPSLAGLEARTAGTARTPRTSRGRESRGSSVSFVVLCVPAVLEVFDAKR
jgi:hypothetical protein